VVYVAPGISLQVGGWVLVLYVKGGSILRLPDQPLAPPARQGSIATFAVFPAVQPAPLATIARVE
jgi:hypothetical protein